MAGEPQDAARLLPLAAAVHAAWEERGGSARTLLAELAPREVPHALRARVAAAVGRAITWRRRLEFLLADQPAFARLRGWRRACVLVIAAAVRSGLPRAEAQRRLAEEGLGDIDLGGPGADEARLAAVADPVQAFGIRWSMPDWLAARFLDEFGERAAAVAQALAAPAPRTIRANLLRVAGREPLARDLAAAGVATRPTAHAPHGLHVDGEHDLFALPQFAAGAFELQDEASQLGALLVAPPPRGRVLDACAGAGGKTLALAAMLGNRGSILAADPHPGRLAALRERLRRAGAHAVRAVPVDEAAWSPEVLAFAATADRIVLDVPCSGIGAWRRHPEGRWSLRAGDLAALHAVQARLLARAATCLRPGARLLWSTCTLFAAENTTPLTALLARHPELERVPVVEVLGRAAGAPIASADGGWLSLWPDRHGCDGFFAGVVRRRRS